MKLISNAQQAQILAQLNGRISLLTEAAGALKRLQVNLDQVKTQMPEEAGMICHNIALTSINTAEAEKEFLELLRDRLK